MTAPNLRGVLKDLARECSDILVIEEKEVLVDTAYTDIKGLVMSQSDIREEIVKLNHSTFVIDGKSINILAKAIHTALLARMEGEK